MSKATAPPIQSNASTPQKAKKQRVGMILDQVFPPDARVEREALALIEAGYEVHILCTLDLEKAKPEHQARESIYENIHIHRVSPEEINFLLPFTHFSTRLPYKGLIKNIFHNIWNIDTVWHTLIRRFVNRFQIDLLHIHDLRLASTGLSVAKEFKIPVICDLHENYPALMELFKGKKSQKRGIAQRKKWDRIQKDCCERALGVITVSQEMKEILQGQGIPDHKITVLPNTVDIEKFQAYSIDPTVLNQHADKFVLTYIGFINGIHRGIHTLLEAIALLKDKIPTLHFVGAGGTREPYLSELKAIIAKHQLEPYVSFTGWLDESAFGSYIQASNVCLTPHIANDQTNTGIPNKVYLYHLWKKPIIASDFIPMKRYLDNTQGGLSFTSGDAQGLADQILTLYENPSLSETLAQNGYEAVIHTYNWRKTSEALKALYEKALPIYASQSTKS